MSDPMRPTRRLFFGAAGAAVAAPLAAAAPALAAAPAGDDLAARLARLEDEKAIRELRDAYVRGVNAGDARRLAALFADPASAAAEPALKSLAADLSAESEAIEISTDGAAATLRAPVVARTETPINDKGTLVDMLREMGEAVVRREERRVLELALVKGDGGWRIESAQLA